MRDDLEKLRLADRTESILRSDRHALRHAHLHAQEPAVLLVLLPDRGDIIDFMDAYVGELAERVGLHYLRLIACGLHEVPLRYLNRTQLVLADITGRDESVITLLYQTFGSGRRVLLAARDPADIPADLSEVPSVFYDLAGDDFQCLLDEARRWAAHTVKRRQPRTSACP